MKLNPLIINEKHRQEWLESAVDPEIIALNIESLKGDEPYQRLLYNWDGDRVHKDAQWRQARKRYGHIENGGWWCNGVDILNPGYETDWGCFKPDRQRTENRDGKQRTIKYEHPPNTSTEVFALKVPRHIWEKISDRYNIPIGEATDFWQWVIDNPVPLFITEGAKKAGALLTAGYVSVALPGIWNGVKSPKDSEGNKIGVTALIPQLKVFTQQQDREIHFCFDQESKRQTRREINKAIGSTGKLFKKAGCSIRVVSWQPGLGKGIDDVLAGLGEKTVDLHKWADDFETWQTKQLTELTFPIALELNSRYLGSFAPPANAKLICLKAPKGTGKTEWLTEQVQELIQNRIDNGGKVLIITHRIQLGQALCNRFGVDYVSELRGDSSTKGIFGYGLCVDSLHPKSQAAFNPKDWEGAWIIIDECEQVFWHLLSAPTEVKKHRVAVLRCLKETIEVVLASNGKIFLSDADLSDCSIEYVQALAGFELKPWIAVNNWKPEKGWDIYNFEGKNPSALIAETVKMLKDGKKLFLCLSGQKKKSPWGTQNLEAYYSGKFPEKRILRIDSESIADPNHPAFGCMEHLNEILGNYDIVLVSPTIETGVSIDIRGHFDAVIGIFQGVQTVDSVRQMLARVRDNCPRYIWCKKIGNSRNRIGNGEISVNSLLASQHMVAKANIDQLRKSDFEDEFDTDFQLPSLIMWAKKAAVVNLGMKDYRKNIIKALQEEGHRIISAISLDEDAIEEVKEEIKETKEINYAAECEDVAKAELIKDDEFKKLKDKKAKNEEDRLRYRKKSLENSYKIDVTPELVVKDDNGWYSHIRLDYYLHIGREHLSIREKNLVKSLLESGEGAIFKPDFNKSALGTKIALLDWLGFDRLLEDRQFCNNDAVICEIAEKIKSHRFEMKAVLGISISAKTKPMQLAQQLLGLIGYSFPFLRKQGGRGQQIRIYGTAAADFERDKDGEIIKGEDGLAIPLSDEREKVFAAWLVRDREALEKDAKDKRAEEMRIEQAKAMEMRREELTRKREFEKATGTGLYQPLAKVQKSDIKSLEIEETHLNQQSPETQKSDFELLVDQLELCQNADEFRLVADMHNSEKLEDAILFADNKHLLRTWQKAETLIAV